MAWFCRIVGILLVAAAVLFFMEYFQNGGDHNWIASIAGVVLGLIFYFIGDSASSKGMSNEAYEKYKELGMMEQVCPKCGQKCLSGISCTNCDDKIKMNADPSKDEKDAQQSEKSKKDSGKKKK